MVKSIHWSYVIGAYLSLFVMGFIDNVRGPAYPALLKHFNITESEGAYFFFFTSVSGAVTSATGAIWGPLLGLKWAIRTALFAQVVGCIGIGWAWGQGWSYVNLIVFATVFGISLGGMSSLCNLLIYSGVPVHLSRRFLSGLHACYGVAALLAPAVVLFFRDRSWTWPGLFILFTILSGVLWLQTTFWPKDTEVTTFKRPNQPISSELRAWLLALASAACVAGEVLVSTRLVVYCQNVVGMSDSQSALMLSLFFLMLLVGRGAFSWLHLPISSKNLLTGSVVAAILLLSLGLTVHPIFLGLSGLAISVFFPSALAVIGDWYPNSQGGMMALLMSTVGTAVVICHWLVGRLALVWGLKGAFWLAPGFMLLSLFLLLILYFFERDSLSNDYF